MSSSTHSSTQQTELRVAAAKAVVNSIQSGDASAITTHVNANVVHHNPSLPNGRDTLLNALPKHVASNDTALVVRAFSDGDFVVTHSEFTLSGSKKVGFDVFRFDASNTIVEHWDNVQDVPDTTANGHTLSDGVAQVSDLEHTAANKSLVESCIRAIFQEGKFEELPKYISTQQYTQHNPNIKDNLAGLGEAGAYLSKFRYDKVVKVLAQGNFVLAMADAHFDGVHTAVYDLFRVDSGKLVEHWDVIQTIPSKEEQKNQNGKF